MKKFYRIPGSTILWSGVLLSSCTLRYELNHHFYASFPLSPAWLHVALIALAPLCLLGAWLATEWPSDTAWTHCAIGLHGFAVVPMLCYVFILPFCLLAQPSPDSPHLPVTGDRPVWFFLALAGLPAGLLAWCVSGIRLRQWRRRLHSRGNSDIGIGWPWAAGLSTAMLALVAFLVTRLDKVTAI